MDQTSQEELNRIVALTPEELTPDEKAFLTARRTYLTEDQKKKFADIIKAQESVNTVEENKEPVTHTKKV